MKEKEVLKMKDFKLTPDGDYDIDNKLMCNVATAQPLILI